MPLRSKRIVVIIICSLVLLAVLAILLPSKRPEKLGEDNRTVDKFSHETISSPSGKTSDKFGSLPNSPVYLGFDKLIDFGLSYIQLNNLKVAFYKYSLAQPQPVKYISVDVDHISSEYNQSDPNALHYIYFNVQFNQKNVYKAKLQYGGLTDVRLFLLTNDNKVIYDSQVLGEEPN